MLFEHVLVRRGLAQWYNGRLIPIVSGGDGHDEPLFPQIPSELASLEDEQLAQHRDTLLARIREVSAGHRDEEVVGALTDIEVEEQLAAAVLAVRQIKDLLASRETNMAVHDAEIARLAKEAGVEPVAEAPDPVAEEAPPEDETAEPEEPTAEVDQPQAVAAAAATLKRRPLPAARRHKPTPQESDTRGLRITSHASGLGAPYSSQTVLDRKAVGEVLSDMIKKRVRPGERAVVAAATFEFPPERQLDQREGELNTEKIQTELDRIQRDHFSPKALVASGGLCAPLTPIYELPGVETAIRPVRDSLPSFQATRGGVIVGATPLLGGYLDAAVGVVTSEENASGGTMAVKNCLRLECPDFQSVEVDSIYRCTEADNLSSKAYPEFMARVDEILRAAQARLADSRLLTTMTSAAAGATKLTGGSAGIGAIVSLMGDVYAAAAQYRSSNRMAPDATLQAIFPFWIIDVLALDFVSGQFDREKTRADIERMLRSANIVPTFTLDGSETATVGQVFARATAGSLDGFAASVEWALFAPGVWLHLDSGQLDLGVVRDSILNSTNDFQVFYETWENVVKVGGDSYAITTTICPSGVVAIPDANPIACAD